ncbi:MAG TPA: hypothetical protein VEU32_12730 [Burkholderiales bacterium]|nr:hypothetical protein [Burkholderiales bacterium]
MIQRWFGFLRLTYAEMIAPLVVALAAAGALAVMLITWGPTWVPPEWALLTPAIAVIGANFWGWTASFRRLRALEDVPRSHIGTCAQGYARLEGRAAVFPGKPLLAPVSQQACCWYRYELVTFDAEGHAHTEAKEETEWSFAMRDETAECIVDPAGAQIFPVRVQSYRDKSQHWTEHAIFPGDPICVVGQFTTAISGVSEAEIEFRVGQLLAEWKRHRQYTEAEWDGVRAQARREVEAAMVREPPQNRIEKPSDDRPFIITAEARDDLERDLLIWAWIHASCFVGGVAMLAWLYFRFL